MIRNLKITALIVALFLPSAGCQSTSGMFANLKAPKFFSSKKKSPKTELANKQDKKPSNNGPVQSMPASNQIVQTNLTMAEQALHAGRNQDAKTAYRTVLNYRPDNVAANQGMGIIADKENNFAEAEGYYQMALRVEPNNADVLANLGFSYYLQNRTNESEQYLLKSLQINPRHKTAAMNLGTVYGSKGDYNHALAMFRQGGTEAEAQARILRLFPNGKPAGNPNAKEIQLVNNETPKKKSWPNKFFNKQNQKDVQKSDSIDMDLTQKIKMQMEQERLKSIAERKQKNNPNAFDPRNPFSRNSNDPKNPNLTNNGGVNDSHINDIFGKIDNQVPNNNRNNAQNYVQQNSRQNRMPQNNPITPRNQNVQPKIVNNQPQRMPQIFKGSNPGTNVPNMNVSNSTAQPGTKQRLQANPYFSENNPNSNSTSANGVLPTSGVNSSTNHSNLPQNNNQNLLYTDKIEQVTTIPYPNQNEFTPQPSMIPNQVPAMNNQQLQNDAYMLARQKAAAMGLQAGPGQMFPVMSQNSNPMKSTHVSLPGSSSRMNGAMMNAPLRTGPSAIDLKSNYSPNPNQTHSLNYQNNVQPTQNNNSNNNGGVQNWPHSPSGNASPNSMITPDNYQGQLMPKTSKQLKVAPATFTQKQFAQNGTFQNSSMPQITPGNSSNRAQNSSTGINSYDQMIQNHGQSLNHMHQKMQMNQQLPPGVGVNVQSDQGISSWPEHLRLQRKTSTPEKYNPHGQNVNRGIVTPQAVVPSQGQYYQQN